MEGSSLESLPDEAIEFLQEHEPKCGNSGFIANKILEYNDEIPEDECESCSGNSIQLKAQNTNSKPAAHIKEVILFPNPTQDNLTVILPENYEEATIQVFNLTGQMLHEAKAEDQYQLSTETLETGIYLLRVSGKQQASKTLRFQVIH